MKDKGIFDNLLSVVNVKQLDNIIDFKKIASGIDDTAKSMSEFVDSYIINPIKGFYGKNDSKSIKDQILYLSDIEYNLFDFANMGSFNDVISRLKELALYEKWDFGIEPEDDKQKNRVLKNYIIHSFSRLADSKQIIVDNDKTIAIFNTGLVNRHYEFIYGLFKKNESRFKQKWIFVDFFIVGEGLGKRVLDIFNENDLPNPPHYFDDPCSLLYDARKGKPTPDYNHCIIDNIHRWSDSVHEHEFPDEWLKVKDKISCNMQDQDKKPLFNSFRAQLKKNDKVFLAYKTRLNDAINLAVKKVSWNYKTAIPIYWPTNKKIELLLPLCLDSDDKPDAALVVNQTKQGYKGETILTLDMAYIKARQVCKPESDWLNT